MAETIAQKMFRLASKQYKDWKEKRFIETGAVKSPEDWIWFEHPTHSDWYNKRIIGDFIGAAKKFKIDPYEFVALGISESGLGNRAPTNPAQIDFGAHYKRVGEAIKKGKVKGTIEYGAMYLAEQLKKYRDKESAIQAYSGVGKTIGDPVKSHRYFGKPVREINIWKEKPQAKRVLDISSKLKEQPEIASLIETLARSGL